MISQILAEWTTYRRLLVERGLFDPHVWVDFSVGNHDTRNTAGSATDSEWIRHYTASGHATGRGNAARVSTHCIADTVRVVSWDQTPRPATHRFFNFFGVAAAESLDDPTSKPPADSQSNSCAGATTTVAVGHYPLFMVDRHPDGGVGTGGPLYGWSRVVGSLPSRRNSTEAGVDAVAYLCGHLHDGLGDTLHTRHPSGLLELEGLDFKLRSAYRIVAVDAGLVTFLDTSIHATWPLIMITTPKPAAYLSPREPWATSLAASTEIHILVFDPGCSSPSNVTVRVWLDDHDMGLARSAPEHCPPSVTHHPPVSKHGRIERQAPCPVYALPWSPRHWLVGLHTIRVEATVTRGFGEKPRTSTQGHTFSIDGV